MKNNHALMLLLIAALGFSTLGLLIDTDVRNSDDLTTLIEFCLMTTIFFIVFTSIYYISRYARRWVNRNHAEFD